MNQLNQKPAKGTNLPWQEVFLNSDKSILKSLPSKPYQYTVVKKSKVHFDYHIEFERHYYSVPYQLVDQHIEIHANAESIMLYSDNQVVTSHKKKLKYGYSTNKNHMPEGKDKNAKWTSERFLKWATMSGGHTLKFVEQILDSREYPAQAYRFLIGLLSLHKNYGYERLNEACEEALNLKVTKLAEIKKILLIFGD